MRQLLDDKRIRYLLVAVLVVVLILGLLNIISTAFSLLVPLAIVAAGGFAFYKIVLEGRNAEAVMDDEIADSQGFNLAAAGGADAEVEEAEANDEDTSDARLRLSAVERAQSEFVDAATPAEEILEQIQSRKQRLTGADDG